MIDLKLRINETVTLRDAAGVIGTVRVVNVTRAGRVSLRFDCDGVRVERPCHEDLGYQATRGAAAASPAELDAIILAWHAALPDDARAADDECFRESLPFLRDLILRARREKAI